jgi:hypothetical protein
MAKIIIIIIIIIMTIIQYQKVPQKDTKILSQCNSLDANLDFAGFQSQKKTEQNFEAQS